MGGGQHQSLVDLLQIMIGAYQIHHMIDVYEINHMDTVYHLASDMFIVSGVRPCCRYRHACTTRHI